VALRRFPKLRNKNRFRKKDVVTGRRGKQSTGPVQDKLLAGGRLAGGRGFRWFAFALTAKALKVSGVVRFAFVHQGEKLADGLGANHAELAVQGGERSGAEKQGLLRFAGCARAYGVRNCSPFLLTRDVCATR
jgi:hypothetical protein